MIEITDVTALACKRKFLEFVDALSNKYPPMTFQEYRDANGNHTNWFLQRYYQSTASMYCEWFTCAVLNNLNFITKVYRQRDPDATKIFTEMINSVDFRVMLNIFDKYSLNCIYTPFVNELENGHVEINYNWNFDISGWLNSYNARFQEGNINTVSSNIRIPDNLAALSNKNIDIKFLYSLGTEYFTYDTRNKLCREKKYRNITTSNIDNMYMIKVKSNSMIKFICFDMDFYDGGKRDFNVDPNVALSLLMSNIADVLVN